MNLLAILPLAIVMIAGPQIISATLLATSENARKDSLAFLAGVARPGRGRNRHPDGPVRLQPQREGLCIGYDGGGAVSREHRATFEFTGGRVAKVVFDVAYVDLEREIHAAIARD